MVLPLDARAAADNGEAGAPTPPARQVTVVVRSEAPDSLVATVRLEAPRGWRVVPASARVAFGGPAESHTLRFTLTPPPGLGSGRYDVSAVAEAAGARYARGYDVIDYPHTRPRVLFHPATASMPAFDVAVAPGLRVGYVEGAGDDGAAALEQLGVMVEKLDAAALANGDLSRFNTIVTGIRAYEVRPDLVAHNDRILAYARAGGTVIVQYNKYEYPRGNFAPYPLTIASPHDRVTDEDAPVTLVQPDHPVLSRPNRIGPADFTDWVQERGLYFAHGWDDRYEPLLEMHDPGEAPLRGGLLVAKYGQGTYVYTGIAFFRQLPEGVAGAWRLLANLVSLGARTAGPVSDASAAPPVQGNSARDR
jgi:hypothetical protein